MLTYLIKLVKIVRSVFEHDGNTITVQNANSFEHFMGFLGLPPTCSWLENQQ